MGISIEKRAGTGTPPTKTERPNPAPPIAAGPVAAPRELDLRQPDGATTFARRVARAVAPAVVPRAATISPGCSPIPHWSADCRAHVLPTYLRHLEVNA
jgi:hypothetical protein